MAETSCCCKGDLHLLDRQEHQGRPITQFQCVCGHQLELPDGLNRETTCPKCRRRLSPDMLRHAEASFHPAASPSMGATLIGQLPPDDDPASLPVQSGERLDHFTVMEMLGAGGMGAVFRARDESLQRFVAIKVIRSRLGEADQMRRERLIQEARAQARVTHPGVVHIYYVGMHEDCPFFAMELVTGQPLAQVIRQRRLAFPEIVQIAIQTVNALEHSAQLGIVHGDVKPGNLLITDRQTVKLSDFGLAGLSSPEQASPSSTGPAGTLNYMAPEVAAGQQADIFSDMYSLGVMLYELTFGELPHDTSSDSLAESLRQRQHAQVHFPRLWPSDRPSDWRRLLARLLSRERAERFASWTAVQQELQRWLPVTAPDAGRITRFVAFGIDCAVSGIIAGLALAASIPLAKLSSRIPTWVPFHIALMLLAGSLLLWWMARSQNTPGKKLMQLQLVDEFGLPPTRWKTVLFVLNSYIIFFGMLADSSLQYTSNVQDQVLETGASSRVVIAAEKGLPDGILKAVLLVWLLLNAAWVIFSSRRQSLFDRLLKLHVVLDTKKPG